MSNTLQKNHAKNMEDILEAKRLRYGKKLKKTMSDTPEIIETETGLKCVTLQDYRELERERDEAITWLRVAAGLLATEPQFENKHPEEVLEFLKEGAR